MMMVKSSNTAAIMVVPLLRLCVAELKQPVTDRYRKNRGGGLNSGANLKHNLKQDRERTIQNTHTCLQATNGVSPRTRVLAIAAVLQAHPQASRLRLYSAMVPTAQRRSKHMFLECLTHFSLNGS
jgi:hypothetical protein